MKLVPLLDLAHMPDWGVNLIVWTALGWAVVMFLWSMHKDKKDKGEK